MGARTSTMRVGILAVATAFALSGCTVIDDLAGVRPAPAESTTGAPLQDGQAQVIAARVLAEADRAEGLAGDEGVAARAAVLTGTALELANARASATANGAGALVRPDLPQVLAASQGRDFPRLLLTTTLDAQSQRQSLQLLMSPDIASPFVVTENVTMLPGATLPGIGDFAQGAPLVAADDGAGMVLAPQAAAEAYAAALGTPDPVVSELVDVSDSYATALKAAQAAQITGLGELATLAQSHAAVPESVRALRLAGGGAVVFAKINRTDVITAGENTEVLNVPENLRALVGGAETATTSITINAMESVVLYVPAAGQGQVTLLGVIEQLTGGAVQ